VLKIYNNHTKLNELAQTHKLNKATVNAFNKIIDTLCNEFNRISTDIAQQNENLESLLKEVDRYKVLYADNLLQTKNTPVLIDEDIQSMPPTDFYEEEPMPF